MTLETGQLIELMVAFKWEMLPVKPGESCIEFRRENYAVTFILSGSPYSVWEILGWIEGFHEWRWQKRLTE